MHDDERSPSGRETGARRGLEAGLILTLSALRPYLPEILLIGGWVPYLHQRYGRFAEWTGALSLTVEADIVLPRSLHQDARPKISEALVRAGLQPDGATGGVVWNGDVARGERLEFFVQHFGTARDIGKATAITGQAGVSAVALRWLSVLERHAVTVAIPTTGVASEGATSLPVRLPVLGAYLLQKGATFTERLISGAPDARLKAAKECALHPGCHGRGPARACTLAHRDRRPGTRGHGRRHGRAHGTREIEYYAPWLKPLANCRGSNNASRARAERLSWRRKRRYRRPS